MRSSTFTTQNLKPSDQLQAWQEWFFPAFEITPLEPDDPFEAQNSLWKLGDVIVSRVLAPSVHVKRTKANLKKAAGDHWVLTYCRQGDTTVRTPKGEFTAPEGVPFFWLFGDEFESKRTRVDRIQVLLPRERFNNLTPALDAARGTAFETPLGALLGDYILALERQLPSLNEDDASRLATTSCQMITACIAPSADRLRLAEQGISIGLFERAKLIINGQLHSFKLQPTMLCRQLGISRSQLYRLFERKGGVTHYIQRQRLIRIFDALCNPDDRRPISAVAADFCFEDPSSFGRAFRREFGCNAGDVRASAAAGFPLQARERTRSESDESSFAHFCEL
jgi:AraC-like DNA-binding protein